MNKESVVIIGNDHINTLGVIRQFGENNVNVDLIIISKEKYSAVAKSKYINNVFYCKDINTGILVLLTEFKSENNKRIIVPTSDEAALYLDMFYEKLKDNFIVPSINCEQGKIKYYMNKFNQSELAEECNVKVARSIKVEPKNLKKAINTIKMPIIIKPNISAEGNKDDIRIVKTNEEIQEIVDSKLYINYNELIIQEFIEYNYELDIVGFSYNGKTSIPGVIKKQRIWPEKKGSTTSGFVQPIETDTYKKISDDIKKIMLKLKYNGIFDIEVFICDNCYYLNEINFRNSAVGYAYGNAYICYYWYKCNLEKHFIESPKIKKEYYFLNEHGDIHNVIEKKISLKDYNTAKKNAEILLVSNKEDSKPAKYMTILKILEKMHLTKIINYSKKILHKDNEEMIMHLKGKNYKEKVFSNDYKIVEINLDNLKNICECKEDNKEFYELFKSGKCKGIYLVNFNKEIIGRGFIKIKGAKNRFTKIKSKNSYLISSINIYEKFRGKNYQCDLMSHLINYYVSDLKKANIYGIVYKYNIPSKRNFEKLGFKNIKNITIIRFLKRTLNKKKL